MLRFERRSFALLQSFRSPRRQSDTCWCYIPVECFTAPCPPGSGGPDHSDGMPKHGGQCFSSREEALYYRNTVRPYTVFSYLLVLLRLRKGHNKGHPNHYGGMPGEGW